LVTYISEQQRALNYAFRTALMFMVVLYSWYYCAFKDQRFNNNKGVSSTEAASVVGV